MSDELINIIAEIKSDLQAIEGDARLYEETNFSSRADAIDFLDFHIIDRVEGLLQKEKANAELIALKKNAEKIKSTLEKIDTGLFKQLREKISAGICTPEYFKAMIDKYLPNYFDAGQSENIVYDNLDNFISGLLSVQTIPEPTLANEPEMVYYQKTPARIIFEMAALTQLKHDDIFFDIGSGLGQVPVLINLLSGATTKGIEYEPAYHNYAATCAAHLNLFNVEFINVDARNADYSCGTVFFMYTPFTGQLLQDVLGLLRKEASGRTIRVFTYGPCSAIVASQTWLTSVKGDADDAYQLCGFGSFLVDLPY